VLARSSNRAPSGQLRFAPARNLPELLHSAQSGFSSLLAAQFLARVTSGARTPPEELVNSASQDRTLRLARGRDQANQPDLAFPQSPGIIHEIFGATLASDAFHLRSFNELPL
jgi:hypothetical protein